MTKAEKLYDVMMRSPVIALFSYFLVREISALRDISRALEQRLDDIDFRRNGHVHPGDFRSVGRSVSVMPEARKLVTSGLYRHIRRPLYLVEEIGVLGLFLQFRSWQ